MVLFYKKFILFLVCLLWFSQVSLICSIPAHAGSDVPKLLYLIVENNKLIASNIKFNRFDEIGLLAKEVVQDYEVGNAVTVVVTNKRIIAYSVFFANWKSKERIANETLESISAEDYSALVVTSRRFLSFNGRSSIWAEARRSKLVR